VECDAAGRGIGMVLMQKRQPIAYYRKALSEGNLAKSIYEKELFALVNSAFATLFAGQTICSVY